MTDKAKIRAEIEKRYRENKADGYSDVCEELWDILSFIDSIQEEPVSESINFEQELYKAFGQVKDFTLCMRIAKRFYDMGEKSREPVSENLEEAVNAYIGYAPEVDECSSTYGKRQAFRAGAEWQKQQDQSTIELAEEHAMLAGMEKMKEQMMKEAIDGVLSSTITGSEQVVSAYVGYGELGKNGDKVKVIVIKED